MIKDEWKVLDNNPFSWKGRIGRIGYFIVLISFILVFTATALGVTSLSDKPEVIFYALPVYIAGALVVFATTIKRMHDIQWSGLFALLLFIPAVNAWLIIYL